jgi:hypothetical protein
MRLKPSMLAGVPHVLPLYLMASPELLTATQNDVDGHDTEFSLLASMLAGVLHVLPLYIATSPAWSTAAQNEADGHETDVAWNAGSTGAGADQPLDAKAVDGPTRTPMIAQASDRRRQWRRGVSSHRAPSATVLVILR